MDEFVDKLSKFQAKWDGHFGCINVTKHPIELLHDSLQPAYSAPYRTGPTIREIEIFEIDKMMQQKVIEPAQIE